MSFVTYEQLARERDVLAEAYVKIAKSLSDRSDLFLSHSQRDEKHVGGAVSMLQERGAKVYVDVFDTQLKLMSQDERTEHLRQALHQCQRLIVLFTPNTHTSRWIPWELGLTDGLRGRARVATFPLSHTEDEEDWGTQEYFGLYPQVRWVLLKGNSRPDYAVLDPSDGQYWSLEQWLKL